MQNWIPITIETLYDHKVAALIDACSTAAKATGQADRAPKVIATVVRDIRRKIASNKSNRLDADPTTIPASLEKMAAELIIAGLKGALSIKLDPAEIDRQPVILSELNRIADGKDTIEQPDAPIAAPVQQTSGVEQVGTTRRLATREKMRGL